MQLLNALPNGFLPLPGDSLEIQGITEQQAVALLKEGFDSFIGHESFAAVLTARTGLAIAVNRGQATPPSEGGQSVVALVQPPRRLPDGEAWTEAELLSMPIKWVLIK